MTNAFALNLPSEIGIRFLEATASFNKSLEVREIVFIVVATQFYQITLFHWKLQYFLLKGEQ